MKPLLDQLMELNKRIEALHKDVAEMRAALPHAFVIDKGRVHQTWCKSAQYGYLFGECNCQTSRSGDVSRPEVDGA